MLEFDFIASTEADDHALQLIPLVPDSILLELSFTLNLQLLVFLLEQAELFSNYLLFVCDKVTYIGSGFALLPGSGISSSLAQGSHCGLRIPGVR